MSVPEPPAGIGIDLLEIGRLERALERRPRLAERLFTDGELAQRARGTVRGAISRPASPPRRPP